MRFPPVRRRSFAVRGYSSGDVVVVFGRYLKSSTGAWDMTSYVVVYRFACLASSILSIAKATD